MGFTVVSENAFLVLLTRTRARTSPRALAHRLERRGDKARLGLGGQVDLHIICVGSRLTYAFDALGGSSRQ